MARVTQEISRDSPRSELAAALAACRAAFVGIFLFSGMIGILALTSTFFVLEIYDRVVPSRSFATLIGLSVLAAVLFMFLGVLDFIRGRVFVRIAAYLDETLGHRIYDATVRLPLIAPRAGDGLQSLRDLDQVRSFLAGGGPAALFDAPFLFLFLFVCFLFHVWLGLAVLFGALVLIALTLLTESLVREPTRTATTHAGQRYAVLEASRRNAEILRAMGMTGRLFGIWSAANRKYMESHQRANDLAAGLGGISRVFRMMLQSVVLAIGAYLVIEQQASGGIIFAAAVLTGRALAPIDLAIGNWNGFVAARQSWHRLNEMLKLMPDNSPPMTLPRPSKSISVENLSVVPPGSRRAARAGRDVFAESRQRSRYRRAQRGRQILACARARRRVGAGTRADPHRRRRPRSMGARAARAPCRLSAAGRRVARRHGRTEYLALRSRARFRPGDRRRQGRGHP